MEYLSFLEPYINAENSKLFFSIILIIILSLLSRPIISKYLLGWIRKFVEKTENEIDDKIIDVMEPPARFISIVIGLYLIAEIYVPTMQGIFIQCNTNFHWFE